MTAVGGKLFPVGTRYAKVYALKSTGYPLSSSPSASYTGLQVDAVKSMQLTVPEPRRITHAGDDRVQAVDSLPPLEGSTAELHVAKTNYTLQALLAGIAVRTIGESKGILYATDQQGFEPLVGLFIYQQALDASGSAGINGSRVWRNIWFPRVQAILMPHGTDDNAADLTYRITPYIGNAYLWGQAYTLGNDGALQAQFMEIESQGKQWLDNWLGDNVTTVFTFSQTAYSALKVTVFKNGVIIAAGAGVTVTTTTATFDVAPATNDEVNILLEY